MWSRELFTARRSARDIQARSANEAAGAKSRASGVYAAAAVLLLVLLFLPWIEQIPEPMLAAIVIHAVSKSLRPSVFKPYFRWQRDRLVTVTAVAAVLLFGMLDGLLAAIAFSLAMLLHSLASPRLSVLGRMGMHDFVSVARFPEAVSHCREFWCCGPKSRCSSPTPSRCWRCAPRQRVLQQTDVRLVILSLEESPDLDGTALESLGDFAGPGSPSATSTCAWRD